MSDKRKIDPGQDKNANLDDRLQQRTQTYQTCPRHGEAYPRGAKCPSCEQEDGKRKSGR